MDMGTRGYVGFRLYDQDKGVYNHLDSYPSDLGLRVMTFVKDKKSMSNSRYAVALLTPVDDDVRGISGGYELLEAISNFDGGQIFIEEYSGFLECSMMCEWAYIINLDSGKLEIYEGYNKDPNAKGRYAHLFDEDQVNNEYYGVALLLKLPFDKIKAMTNDQIEKLCDIMDYGNEGNRIESYLQNLPKYSVARPPTTVDRIQLLELM
jgi:hypothetical protein